MTWQSPDHVSKCVDIQALVILGAGMFGEEPVSSIGCISFIVDVSAMYVRLFGIFDNCNKTYG